MAGVLHGRALGLRLCEALGLDPSEIVSIDVHADCDDVASVTVRRLVPDDTALGAAFTDYELVEKAT